MDKKSIKGLFVLLLTCLVIFAGCGKSKNKGPLVESDAPSKVYVEPGKYDEFYAFVSGGFSGQLAVYGLPSGRLLRVVPVFSQNPEN